MRLLLFLLLCTLITCEAVQVKGKNGKIYDGVMKILTDNARKGEADKERDIFDINRDLEGLIGGDILPYKETRNTITNTDYYWPTTTIPYTYSTTLGAIGLEAVGSIELAIQEYKLRTCLNFVPRTTEDNYIRYEKQSGCYSSVGMVGGRQTISIGSGCERMGTVCHEMMHAIGIYHEQSRADRDDYVTIEWANIQAGKEHNFDRKTWETTDVRRVNYDYNSVMHYSDTGFSTNGDPTIVTKDSAFQDIIGQRNTFSEGDSTKINRMYGCSDTLLNTFNCNFNDESECGYVQAESNDVDWLRYDVGDKTVTVSANVPTTDSTSGVTGQGTYMIMDTSQKETGKVGEMQSMRFTSKSADGIQCLRFSFYLHRDAASAASIAVYVASVGSEYGEVADMGDPIVTLDADYGAYWQIERLTINAPSAYKLVFVGKTGGYDTDVIAVDDVSVQDKHCEDDYFVVNDYSSVLSSYAKGQSFMSPVMTSAQGYNFQLKIYPNGGSSASTGYMSLYFGIVQGPDDDTLAWPFCNKFVRPKIVDHSDNPLYSMDKYNEFLTSQSSGGDLWNKPTSTGAAGYWGWSSFMKVSDLQNTYNYLKNDALMISVLIQDMNWFEGTTCSGSFTRSIGDQPAAMSVDSWEWEADDHKEENHDDDDDQTHDDDDHYHDDDDDHHDDDHDHDEDNDGMISVGAAAGIAVGVGLFVFLVMSVAMCVIVKSHRQNAKKVSNSVVVHTNTSPPPAYPGENVAFEDFPVKNV